MQPPAAVAPGKHRETVTGDWRTRRSEARRGLFSDVVVELELVRVGPQLDGRDLLGPLEVDPGLDQVVGEDTAGRQVVVVGLERVETRLAFGFAPVIGIRTEAERLREE